MKRIRFFVCLMATVLIISILFTPVLGQTQPNTKPELDHYFEESFKKANYTNAAAIIVSKDEVLYQYGYGKVQTFDEQFVIGSSSKSFTALAAMRLVEEGKMDLDLPISTYLGNTWVPESVSQYVTARQLMNQTSGIHQYHLHDIGELQNQGHVYYSNANFDLLGLIIEQVSKQAYGDYMQAALFEPMGLLNTTARNNADPSVHLIGGSKTYFGFNIPAQQTWSNEAIPSGYIASSPNDMAAYLQMYLNGGEGRNKRVVNTDTIEQIFSQPVAIDKGSPLDKIVDNGSYGFGWFIGEKNGVNVVTHGGNIETYSAAMTMLPEKEVGIVILVSSDDYFAGQALLGEIEKGAISYLETGEVPPVIQSNYWPVHWIMNGILLLLIGLCVVALLRLKKWQTKSPIRQSWSMLLSLAVPAVLFVLLPAVVNVPYNVIWGFATDTAFVLLATMACLFALGLYKAFYMLFRNGRRNKGYSSN